MEYTTRSFEKFSASLIDYAGLFPPAKLPLDEAFRNYLEYKKGRYAYMLSKFIIPAGKLADLTLLMNEIYDFPLVTCSVILRGGESIEEFTEKTREDLKLVRHFLKEQEGRADVDCFEVRLPSELLISPSSDEIHDFFDSMSGYFIDIFGGNIKIFYEILLSDGWERNVNEVITAIRKHNDHLGKTYTGFKLRTGGVEASTFPTIEQVAYVIKTASDSAIPLKFTAGLHHPVRHFSNDVDTMMHGFLNIFGSCMIARCCGAGEKEIAAAIGDEDPEAFEFNDEYMSWRDFKVITEDIEKVRNEFALSYGSCSFTEPIDDLYSIGLFY